MPELSQRSDDPTAPEPIIPRAYNAAHDLIERNLRAGRADKIAYIDGNGRYSYGELAERVQRCANALRGLEILPEQRVLISTHDDIESVTIFLGCITAGIIPIPVNTLLTVDDYRHMLRDSRAVALVVAPHLLPTFQSIRHECPHLRHVLVTGNSAGEVPALSALMAAADPHAVVAETTSDDPCFWLYSSGSTGGPKGTVHVHSSMVRTAELYAGSVLRISESDILFSAAKLFFAYGLGNGLSFPMNVGATTVLMADRPTPEAVVKRLVDHKPTIFFGVPTLYASLLASESLQQVGDLNLRICVSAGEALPADIGRRWKQRLGVDILDGIGSTEMLHIFLSNQLGDVQYGCSGKVVSGYELSVRDAEGAEVPKGELGELWVRGATAANGYWNNRERSRRTFVGEWTRSGDQYIVNEAGYYVHAGRTDDMLKVSGLYVSPTEVEGTLVTHEAVLEVAVIGAEDPEGLTKPAAFVVLHAGFTASPELRAALKSLAKQHLAPYKYPRWFVFVDELPKTATGKIQRFRLRQMVAISGIQE